MYLLLFINKIITDSFISHFIYIFNVLWEVIFALFLLNNYYLFIIYFLNKTITYNFYFKFQNKLYIFIILYTNKD